MESALYTYLNTQQGRADRTPPWSGLVSSVMYQYIISHNKDTGYLFTGSVTSYTRKISNLWKYLQTKLIDHL